ncbi:MAG: single-stranded-DNA-specific exonuclease RecJ [Spirochaetaceae bacterium]|jgi:single-stranded-DNA-specific exonuclease|nr:single-stranded-DNA-specific exonuclease RecJ [Spirochaetaceae bacterium]
MNWNKKELDGDLVNNLAEKYGRDKLIASILARRGLIEPAALFYFLENDKRHLRNPFELAGMEDAVEKILDTKEDGGKILVFGDRDTDGITGTALLVRYLRSIGADVTWRVPVGEEPYGLSLQAVEDFAGDYGSLIITVDCGITCQKEIARANELRLQVIITDHHEPRGALPDALTIINPKLRNDDGGYLYPFQGLAGCAIAYKLTQALDFAQKSSLWGQRVCLLNCRPGNDDTWHIELLKLRNLVETSALTETFVVDGADAKSSADGKPSVEGKSSVSIAQTRLPGFLEGQHIYAWDAPLQKKALERIFGRGIDWSLIDLAPEAAKLLPYTAGKSLLRLREMSRLGRYRREPLSELEVFAGIFRAVFQAGEHFFEDEDTAPAQLAAIGSIADMMNMEDENRILVRNGLSALNKKAASGLSDLIFKLNISGGDVNSYDVAWKLAPAINSAGRMGNAAYAVELLLEDDRARREELAAQVIRMNDERKLLTDKAIDIALPKAEKSLKEFYGNLVFAADEKIPRGVTGLAAGRLANIFNVPALVVSLVDGGATGSIRSSRGYNVQNLLNKIAEFCIDCGGHEFAAGFLLDAKNWDAFVKRLKDAAYTMEFAPSSDSVQAGEDGATSEETLNIDAELPLSYLTPSLFTLIDTLEPYGKGWSEPLFLARRLKILDLTLQGRPEAKHVKLTLDAGRCKWPAMYWSAADKVNVEWTKGDTVDAVFKVTRDKFGGKVTPTLIISDLKLSASGV